MATTAAAAETVANSNGARDQCIYNTLREMIIDRGYTIDEKYNSQDTIKLTTGIIFIAHLRQSTSTSSPPAPPLPQRSIVVFYTEEPKIGIEQARKYEQTLASLADGKQNYCGILVYDDKQTSITSVSKANLKKSKKHPVELFTSDELYRNITRHALYSDHYCLSAQETAQVLDKYDCTLDNFGSIRTSDPVAKYFAWPVNSLIKTVLNIGNGQKYERYCVVRLH